MDYILICMLNGIVTGMLLFLLASGLTIILSLLGIMNFAHAGFYMFGSYLAFALGKVTGYWSAIFLAPLVTGVLGALIERYGLQKIQSKGHLSELIFTFALVLIFEQLVSWIWGKSDVGYQMPEVLNFTLFSIGDFGFSAYRAFILGVSVLVLLLIYLVFSKTRLGLVIKAAIENPDMVAALGHHVPLLFTMVFGVGCAIAALGGAIAGPLLGTYPGMALSMGPMVFVVVIIGGLGSLGGSFLAALLVGISQSFAIASTLSFRDVLGQFGIEEVSNRFLQDLQRISLASLGPLIPYLFLILFCVIRPSGLLGDRDA